MDDPSLYRTVTVEYNVAKCETLFGLDWGYRVDTLYEINHCLRSGARVPQSISPIDRFAGFGDILDDVNNLIRINAIKTWASADAADPITLLIDRVKKLRALLHRRQTPSSLRKALENLPTRVVSLDPEDCRWWPLAAFDKFLESMNPSFDALFLIMEPPFQFDEPLDD